MKSKKSNTTLIILLFLFPFLSSIGQIRKYIPGIKIDSIIIQDNIAYPMFLSNNDIYRYNLNTYFKTSLKKEKNPAPEFYLMDSTIYTFAPYQSGFLIGLGNGLLYFDEGHLKKWNFPLSHQEGKVTLISVCEENFYFYQDQQIYYWDNQDYSLSALGRIPGIHSMGTQCDRWGLVWASDGEILYQIGSPNDRLPYLEVVNLNQSSDRVSYQVQAYHPSIEKLIIEYKKYNDDLWKTVPESHIIDITIPTDSSFLLQLRASVDGKYYAYSSPIQIRPRSTNNLIWYFLIIPLTIIGMAFYFYNKEKRFKYQLNEMKEKYKKAEELRILQDQRHQLQMNPHFIFNSLNSINALIGLNENKKARTYLQKFSNLMRSVLNFSNKKTIDLDKEILYLRNYLDLEIFSRNDSFDYEIVNELEDETYIPPMIIQPFLENAIVHGFKGINHRGLLQINFKEKPGFVIVEITDNGIGINQALKKSKQNHQSMAIGITKDRLKNISKFRPGELIIKDLSTEETSKTGTQVIITIPL